jgi:hypothetical protein
MLLTARGVGTYDSHVSVLAALHDRLVPLPLSRATDAAIELKPVEVMQGSAIPRRSCRMVISVTGREDR